MAIFHRNPKCPHCEVELDLDDTYDIESTYEDGEDVILHQIGTCPECGLVYQWEVRMQLTNHQIEELRLT